MKSAILFSMSDISRSPESGRSHVQTLEQKRLDFSLKASHQKI